MPDTAQTEAIGHHARAGIAWLTGLNFFRDLLQFGVMLVLVRLLDPKFYGEFALVSSCIGLVTILSSRSFTEYTLQIRAPDTPDYQTFFTIGGLIQAVAVVVLNVAALVMRHFPVYAPIAPVLHVMSIFFVADWVSEFRVKMLERDMAWGRLRLLQACGVVAGAALSIGLAFAGMGVYALVLPMIVSTVPFVADLLFGIRWRPTWTANMRNFRPAWHYGFTRIGSGIALQAQQLLEGSVMVGMTSFAAYGIYGRALGLANITCLKLSSLLLLTLLPVLTRLAPGSERYRQASALILRAVAWTSVPIAAVFAMLAGPVVHVLYGSKWDGAIPLLPWALLVTVFASLRQMATVLLLANLQQRKCMHSDAAMLAGTALALALALPHGAAAYLMAMAGVQAASLVLMMVWLKEGNAISMHGVREALVPPLVVAFPLMAAGVLLEARFQWWTTGGASARTVAEGIAAGAVFTVLYLAGLRLFSEAPLIELIDQLPRRLRLRSVFLLAGDR